MTMDMMTLLLQTLLVMQMGAKFMFGQDHNTLGILAVSILSVGPCGLRIQEVPHMSRDFTPITICLLFFVEVVQLLVAENKYYSQC